MENEHTLLSVFVSWFPMLLLIAVWIWFTYKFRKSQGSSQGTSYGDLMAQHYEQQKRTNELLVRLVEDYGERIRRLEEKG